MVRWQKMFKEQAQRIVGLFDLPIRQPGLFAEEFQEPFDVSSGPLPQFDFRLKIHELLHPSDIVT